MKIQGIFWGMRFYLNHEIVEWWNSGFLKDISIFNFIVKTIIAINPTVSILSEAQALPTGL